MNIVASESSEMSIIIFKCTTLLLLNTILGQSVSFPWYHNQRFGSICFPQNLYLFCKGTHHLCVTEISPGNDVIRIIASFALCTLLLFVDIQISVPVTKVVCR